MAEFVHEWLPCGIEYGVAPFPGRHVVSFQIRMLAGTCSEPADKLGLAHLVEGTIDKGTQQRSGRELSDAFDAIGAAHHSAAGRETTTFTCTVLPDHFDRAVALYAELLRTPTFPEEAYTVSVELARQELTAMQDDAHAMVDKLISVQAFGPLLGRHVLGERQTLDRITRDDLEHHWRSQYGAGRMLLAVAGAVDPQRVAEVFENHFAGFGDRRADGRMEHPVVFTPGATHHHKDLEQIQIGMCWPGVSAPHDDFPVQQVMLGILAGGMSGRLFTEVREKLGLVYWVSAWQDLPRGFGMIFFGASTTSDRCDRTYTTLLGEVDRLSDDIHLDELDRAITGIVTQRETRGDSTRARCTELAGDLFHYGRPVPTEEKIAKVQAVTIADIQRYLVAYPRHERCTITLGPRPLSAAALESGETGPKGRPKGRV